MRRRRRRSYLAAAILFFLCGAAAMVTPLTYWDGLGSSILLQNDKTVAIIIGGGSLCIRYGTPNPQQQRWIEGFSMDPAEFAGHSMINFVHISTPSVFVLGVPLWLCSILFGYFGWYFFRFRKKFAPGQCPVCGYDLSAAPHRCPECGTPVVAPATSKPHDVK